METLKASRKNLDSTTTEKERKWIGDLPLLDNANLTRHPKDYQKGKIRLSRIDFEKWRKKHSCLFFDGASRGNLGEAGVGGVLYYHDENIEFRYSWWFGTKYNNQEEALALLKGCQIALILDYRVILIFGDSLILIKSIIHGHALRNVNLNSYWREFRLFYPNLTL